MQGLSSGGMLRTGTSTWMHAGQSVQQHRVWCDGDANSRSGVNLNLLLDLVQSLQLGQLEMYKVWSGTMVIMIWRSRWHLLSNCSAGILPAGSPRLFEPLCDFLFVEPFRLFDPMPRHHRCPDRQIALHSSLGLLGIYKRYDIGQWLSGILALPG